MLELIAGYIPKLIAYFPVTLAYVLASLALGALYGAVLLVCKLSGFAPLRWVANGLTTLARCCPTVIMLFLVYYGLPPLLYSLTGIDIENSDSIYFVIVSFVFFLGGSLSEVARSAYLSIDRGQFEAAACVGLSGAQTIRRIIAPQLFYLMIPNLGNTVQFLMKEGALTYMIGCIDLTGAAYLINGREMSAHVLEVYLALALIFWVLSIVVDWAFAAAERRFGRGYWSMPNGNDTKGGSGGIASRLRGLIDSEGSYKVDTVAMRSPAKAALARVSGALGFQAAQTGKGAAA